MNMANTTFTTKISNLIAISIAHSIPCPNAYANDLQDEGCYFQVTHQDALESDLIIGHHTRRSVIGGRKEGTKQYTCLI